MSKEICDPATSIILLGCTKRFGAASGKITAKNQTQKYTTDRSEIIHMVGLMFFILPAII